MDHTIMKVSQNYDSIQIISCGGHSLKIWRVASRTACQPLIGPSSWSPPSDQDSCYT